MATFPLTDGKRLDRTPQERIKAVPVAKGDLVTATLACLAEDAEQLGSFLDATGQDIGGLRNAVTQDFVQNGLIDFMLANEQLLVAVAAKLGRLPQLVAETAMRLRLGKPEN